jgi:glucose/arabinose dehydrogenase
MATAWLCGLLPATVARAQNFPKQLRTAEYNIDVELYARDLDIPWAIAFVDRETALVTERPGTLRILKNGRAVQERPVQGTPRVRHFGQGGLMDVALEPGYAPGGWVYLAYTHELDDGRRSERMMTRIVRGRLRDNSWTDQQVVWEARPDHYLDGGIHFGCRMVFGADGHLYISIGERGRPEHAQDLARPNGKIHRIKPDGGVPDDNPFTKARGAVTSIFCYGNRNPQGMAVHPISGEIFFTEHGPRGGDELNVLSRGANFGWPVITYGINYDGTKITDETAREGMEQPLKHWTPSIAVCGLDFVRGRQFEKWENRLLVGGLVMEELRLVKLDDQRVVDDQLILKGAGRVRDVRCGPDGLIYVVLNTPDIILRLTPRSP